MKNILTQDDIKEEDLTIELLILADKYRIEQLYKICQEHLHGSMTKETILDVIKTADMINDEELMSKSAKFIAMNHALQPEMLSNWVFRALYKCDPIKLLAEYVEFNEIKGIFIHGAPHRCSECQRTKIDILFSKMPKNAKIVNFLYVSGNTVTFCKQKMVKIPSSYLGRKKSVW